MIKVITFWSSVSLCVALWISSSFGDLIGLLATTAFTYAFTSQSVLDLPSPSRGSLESESATTSCLPGTCSA